MSKKNLPNIPIYIGDWLKDCSVLSLKTEAAWLRIIFQMFTNGKQSTYKIPTNGLQNLWRVSANEVQEIIQEMLDYDICEISTDGRYTEFLCRRFKKENEISSLRKEAVKKRYSSTKDIQTHYKTSTKSVQNTENENDYENDNVIVNKKGGVGEKPTFEDFRNYALEKEPSVNQKALKYKYDAWAESGWRDGNGQPIKNWKTKLLNTMPFIEKDYGKKSQQGTESLRSNR